MKAMTVLKYQCKGEFYSIWGQLFIVRSSCCFFFQWPHSHFECLYNHVPWLHLSMLIYKPCYSHSERQSIGDMLSYTQTPEALTGDSPQHREVSTIGYSCRISETIFPQVGPVPSHPNDEGSSLSSQLGDPPVIHGHSAQHEHPSQRWSQKA